MKRRREKKKKKRMKRRREKRKYKEKKEEEEEENSQEQNLSIKTQVKYERDVEIISLGESTVREDRRLLDVNTLI